MLERGLIAIGLIIIGVVFYSLWSKRQRKVAEIALPGLEGRIPNIHLIVYFTTITCSPCKTVQRPALEKVQQTFGDRLQVITIDACEQVDLANQWGVMTVPSTFIFSPENELLAHNIGVANVEKLLMQLQKSTPQPESVVA